MKKMLLFMILSAFALSACTGKKETEEAFAPPVLETVQPTESGDGQPENTQKQYGDAVVIGEAETGPGIAVNEAESVAEGTGASGTSPQEPAPSDGFQETESLTEEGSDDTVSSETSEIPETSESTDPSGVPETSQAIATSEDVETVSDIETASPAEGGSASTEYLPEGAWSAEESIPSSIGLGEGYYGPDDEQFEEIQDIYRAMVESMEQDEELQEFMREAAKNIQ